MQAGRIHGPVPRARRGGFAWPVQLAIFAAVGLGNALVDAGAFALLVRLFDIQGGWQATLASTVGFAAGALHSYIWNSRVTFRSGDPHRGVLGRFVAVVVLGALVSAAAFAIAHALWPLEPSRLFAAKFAAMVVGAIANFSLMRLWAFAPRRQSGRPSSAPSSRRRWYPLALVLLIAIALRVPFLTLPGFWWDIDLFSQWANTAVHGGLPAAIRRPDMDYVGYNYVLFALGALYMEATQATDLAASWGFGQTLKLVPLLGDLGICALLFLAAERWSPSIPEPGWLSRVPWLSRLTPAQRLGTAAALLYACNPATLYDSAYWGQVDSVITLAMLGALLLMLASRPGWAGAVLATGFLVKPHPVLLVPLLVWGIWRLTGVRGLVQAALGGGVVLLVGLGYFWVAGVGSQVREIYDHLFETGDQVSVSAWNMWWIAYRQRGNVQPSDVLLQAGPVTVTILTASKGMLAVAVAIACASVGPKPTSQRVLLAASFLVFSFFMLTMKMHERYLFPLFALLAPIAVLDRRWAAMYLALSATFVLNLYSLYPLPPPEPPVSRHYIGPPADVWLSLANCALYLVFAALLTQSALRSWQAAQLGVPRRLPVGIRARARSAPSAERP